MDACVGVLDRRGRVVVITAPPDGLTTFNLRKLYRQEGRVIGIDSLKLSSVEGSQLLSELDPGFQVGALRPPAVTQVPLEGVVQAYEARGTKRVLVPHH